MNRLANTQNEYQGDFKKVLCVCSAGLLRSPTAALVLSQEPYNFNTRCAGTSREYALVLVDEFLLKWADEIVCMDGYQQNDVWKLMTDEQYETIRVLNLGIDDDYRYRDPILMKLIAERYDVVSKQPKEPIITRDE